jgi:hypothetical protein
MESGRAMWMFSLRTRVEAGESYPDDPDEAGIYGHDTSILLTSALCTNTHCDVGKQLLSTALRYRHAITLRVSSDKSPMIPSFSVSW